MKLSTTFEKTFRKLDGTIQTQELVIWAEANSKYEAMELSYDDFKADLYIDGIYIADISYVLSKSDALTVLIDTEDWAKIYADEKFNKELSEMVSKIKIERP